jgi:prolyl 4-hydroxylase
MSGPSLDTQVMRAEELAGTGDAAVALALLVDAAGRDHAYAAALLGAWQVLGHVAAQDVEAGISRLRSAAAAGESAACAFLASLYSGGLQVAQDWSRALDWLLDAARLGNARALTQLALLAAGEPPDPLRLHLLFAAASRAFAPAQFLLGRELLASSDARQRAIGDAWIGTAAQAGDPSARALLRRDHTIARSPAPAPVEGFDWSLVRQRCEPGPWLSPGALDVVHPFPQVSIFRQLVPPAWCQYVMGLAASRLARATVNDIARGRVVHEMRSNSSTSFPATDSDVLLQLIAHRAALACALPLAHQEQTAVLHYLPGQSYEDHFDFIDPDVPGFRAELETRGQRIATVLVYLATECDGGETDFPQLGWKHKGESGDALIFRNVTESGEPDRRMLHAGRAPRRGEKWLLSKWVRSQPQAARDRG